MRKVFTGTALAGTLAVFAFAQSPQANQNSATGQSFRGVLMDASCQAIQSQSSGANNTGAATARTSGSTGVQSGAQATSSRTGATTSIGGSAAMTASGAGASGSLSTTTNSGGTAATSNTAAATTGANQSHSGQAGAHAITPPTEARSTATASGPGASGSSSVTTYSGTTGSAAANNPSTGSSTISTNQGTGTGSGSAAQSGERSRAVDDAGAGNLWTTVREKYTACRITPNTSSFALMSNGQVYMLDDASGMVRQRMSSAKTGGSDWHSVSVMGTMDGSRIRVSSIQ